MPIVKTYAKGQLVIPKKIRKVLGLNPGQKVKLKLIDDKRVELTPVPDNPVEAYCGVFGNGSSLTRSLIKEHRDEKTRERENTDRLLRTSRLSKKRK